MKKLLIIILVVFLPNFSRGQTQNEFSFTDKDGMIITISEPSQLNKTINYNFIKNNIHGRLFLEDLDNENFLYEFIISAIKPIKNRNKYDLIVYVNIKPKFKGLGHYGKIFYTMTVKRKGGQYILDNMYYMNTEI